MNITAKEKIIGAIFLIAFILLLFFFLKPKDYVNEIISDMVDSQIQTLKEKDKAEREQLKRDIDFLQKKNNESDKNIVRLNNKIKKLEGNINENKNPESKEELFKRFNAIDFHPFNCCPCPR